MKKEILSNNKDFSNQLVVGTAYNPNSEGGIPDPRTTDFFVDSYTDTSEMVREINIFNARKPQNIKNIK